jgi:hypothetical protein
MNSNDMFSDCLQRNVAFKKKVETALHLAMLKLKPLD